MLKCKQSLTNKMAVERVTPFNKYDLLKNNNAEAICLSPEEGRLKIFTLSFPRSRNMTRLVITNT